VPGEAALVLSVLTGLVGLVAVLPGGLVWLLTRDKGETMDYQTLESEPVNASANGKKP
ncbi:MAG: hypothetical protein JKY68_09595, partial [Rhodospirillales bacterium]|nr:hypothetical protein [Rhodospirillales bacterium]